MFGSRRIGLLEKRVSDLEMAVFELRGAVKVAEEDGKLYPGWEGMNVNAFLIMMCKSLGLRWEPAKTLPGKFVKEGSKDDPAV
jgi:hypothetical protein